MVAEHQFPHTSSAQDGGSPQAAGGNSRSPATSVSLPPPRALQASEPVGLNNPLSNVALPPPQSLPFATESQDFATETMPPTPSQSVHPLARAPPSTPSLHTPVSSHTAMPAPQQSQPQPQLSGATLSESPASTARSTPAPSTAVYPKTSAPQQPNEARASPAAQVGASAPNTYRPLNVKDALTYLDQVKIQFSDQPEIYNKFLDIMKDFKSQAIDTPGVIERVSSLFRGHPSLISGFNTFLPPGYRIECTTDDRERDVIKVTTPSGTTSTTDGVLGLSSASRYYQQPYASGGYGKGIPGSSSGHRPLSSPIYTPPPAQEDPNLSRRAPVEFNHAINYVNKIKTRFADDPDTYKQFLEILQTYQKEQKPIKEVVYAQVQVLFNGAHDLLEEFKQFLPDTSEGQQAGVAALFGASNKSTSMLPMVPPARKKRLGSVPGGTFSKRSKLNPKADPEDIDMHTGDFDKSSHHAISVEEAEFFERAKKYIGNKATYNSFLKLLNLFSQQIVDQTLLVTRVESFIGGNRELFDWFKQLVGYDARDDVVQNEPTTTEKPNLSQCRSVGPSYRKVPKEWRNAQCSGRDELCWQVLNDKYVSHPRWASEDGRTVTTKKNHFEEALHRVEDERYDYDLSIEANQNTISLLEPIAKKISVMTPEEKEEFRLPVGLGGPSKAIYQHIIKKIYGNERGVEIIELLHVNPIQTVPVLLKRLKQKDDEWKRAQREWNKIWREVEAKNYYKALDYQGVTFKSSDKKAMSTKSLLSEMEAIKSSQPELLKQSPEKRQIIVPDNGSRRPPQFTFTFDNQSVFADVSRTVSSFLDRQETYGPNECDAIHSFLEAITALFFAADGSSGNDKRSSSMEDDAGEETEEDENKPTSAQEKRADGKQPANEQDGDVEMTNADDAAQEPSAKESTPVELHTLFGNDNFYCFTRLYQMLYERLEKMRKVDAQLRKYPEETKKEIKCALELGISSKTLHDVNLDFTGGYYNALLDLIDAFFDNTLDQNAFEECSRYIFGSKAYIMFTVDKLTMLMIKHMHYIMSDRNVIQLLNVFKHFRKEEHPDPHQLAVYKHEVEQLLGPNENIYAMVYNTHDRILTIQSLDPDDYAMETDARAAYNEYIRNFADFNTPTQGVDESAMQPRFLKRTRNEALKNEDALVRPGMQYKISKETYHMFYIIDTEDTLIRKRRVADTAPSDQARQAKWEAWLNSEKGWSREVEDKALAEEQERTKLTGQASQNTTSSSF